MTKSVAGLNAPSGGAYAPSNTLGQQSQPLYPPIYQQQSQVSYPVVNHAQAPLQGDASWLSTLAHCLSRIVQVDRSMDIFARGIPTTCCLHLSSRNYGAPRASSGLLTRQKSHRPRSLPSSKHWQLLQRSCHTWQVTNACPAEWARCILFQSENTRAFPEHQPN